jgi:hypothetical protein
VKKNVTFEAPITSGEKHAPSKMKGGYNFRSGDSPTKPGEETKIWKSATAPSNQRGNITSVTKGKTTPTYIRKTTQHAPPIQYTPVPINGT